MGTISEPETVKRRVADLRDRVECERPSTCTRIVLPRWRKFQRLKVAVLADPDSHQIELLGRKSTGSTS